MAVRTRLGLAALGALAIAAPASAQDLGSRIGGAFTDAYRGLKTGVLDAYEGGTRGAQGLWNKATRELDRLSGHAAPGPEATAAPSCKPYQQRLLVDGKEQVTQGMACLQPDGSWKPVD